MAKLEKLRDPDLRRHAFESRIVIGLAFQIQQTRTKRGLSVEQLAELAGVSAFQIRRLENHCDPDDGLKVKVRTLFKIANALDVALAVHLESFGDYIAHERSLSASRIAIEPCADELDAILKGAGE